MVRRVFADTHFYIALLSPKDADHLRALRFLATSDTLEFVTTTSVLGELGNAMCRPRQRVRFSRFLNTLRNDTRTRVIDTGRGLFWRGIDFFCRRLDKEWSLTDCISFTVMADEGITEALTGDHHFEQAGFVSLLK